MCILQNSETPMSVFDINFNFTYRELINLVFISNYINVLTFSLCIRKLFHLLRQQIKSSWTTFFTMSAVNRDHKKTIVIM